MTVVSDLVSNGYRESNLVADGQALTTSQTTVGLARLSSLLLSCLGADLGYIMEDWNVTDNSVVKPSGVPVSSASLPTFVIAPQSRFIVSLAAAKSYKLDPQPQDGQRVAIVDAARNFATNNLTILPNGRQIDGATSNLVLSTDGFTGQWVYRSDIGSWQAIDPLTADAEFPFPPDFDDYFSILLAQRLNPRYGRQLDAQSSDRYAAQQSQFVNRYTQSRLRSVPSPAASNPARPQGAAQ